MTVQQQFSKSDYKALIEQKRSELMNGVATAGSLLRGMEAAKLDVEAIMEFLGLSEKGAVQSLRQRELDASRDKRPIVGEVRPPAAKAEALAIDPAIARRIEERLEAIVGRIGSAEDASTSMLRTSEELLTILSSFAAAPDDLERRLHAVEEELRDSPRPAEPMVAEPSASESMESVLENFREGIFRDLAPVAQEREQTDRILSDLEERLSAIEASGSSIRPEGASDTAPPRSRKPRPQNALVSSHPRFGEARERIVEWLAERNAPATSNEIIEFLGTSMPEIVLSARDAGNRLSRMGLQRAVDPKFEYRPYWWLAGTTVPAPFRTR